ncbi:MAG: hypothetical protein NFW04_05280 [Candidatus Accumulibacter sp.]|uniref:Mor transcription activator family protein n=1 Tax=Accumulibacter sp. TaxID=2053492 RepID=UPI0025DE2606|nr:Mor transcription activator family protein [Accumulibacter sp.]MCM8598053.1 hypothetical protein [Accumulibacter sp.]
MTLPQSIRDLSDVIGLDRAFLLVKAYGGTCLQVPVGRNDECEKKKELLALLGEEYGNKFLSHYGGERMTVPRCHMALLDCRNREIIAAHSMGKSVDHLGRQYRLTTRQIRNILKRIPDPSEIPL